MKTNRQYDKTNEVAFISRTTNYTTEDGTTGTETSIYKKIYGGKHFWRVWLNDLLMALGLINNSRQLDVVFHIFANTDASTNLYINTIRKIAEEVGVSTRTVQTTINKLLDAGVIIKKQTGVYMIKPALMMKGNDNKKRKLIIEYENIKQEQEKSQNESNERADTTSTADEPI